MAKPISVTVFGVKYVSRRQACIAHNQSPVKIDHRLRKGMSLEEALFFKDRYTGAKKHPLYSNWNGIMSRCYSASASGKRYRGRIEVCDRWRNDFWAFVDDMGDPPGLGYSIDRRDNEKGYYKENCRWATRKQQQRNMRSNVRVKAYDFNLTMIEWQEKTGIPAEVISLRIKKGLSAEEALSTPVRNHCRSRYKPTKFGLGLIKEYKKGES